MIPRMLMTQARIASRFLRAPLALTAAIAAVGNLAAATPAAQAQSRPAMRVACPAAPPGYARCFALYRPQVAVNRAIAAGIRGPAAQPRGWSPRAIRAAYKLPVALNPGQTVAVSIAFDTPKLAQYLGVYRKQYGMPPCTVASGCFTKVNQQGKASPLPRSGVGSGWDVEASLDVAMISGACPNCKILVVEAKNPSVGILAVSENAAARLGAQVISNSYGLRENGFAQAFAASYNHPGHTIVVASGDFGFTAAQFPANLTTVTAVGGTQLTRANTSR